MERFFRTLTLSFFCTLGVIYLFRIMKRRV